MAPAVPRKATFDELYAAIQALGEGITGEILMDGRIETMGRPGRSHSRFSARLLRRLTDLEDDRSSGWVFEWEREIRITVDRLVVPDLAGWRVLAEDTTFLDENPIRRVPYWTCEVLSDSTRNKDPLEKLPLYLRAGVSHVWLADPEQRRIEVFVVGDGEPVRIGLATGDAIVTLPPFSDVGFDLATFWVPSTR